MAVRDAKYWAALEEATDTDMNKAPDGWLGYKTMTASQSGITTEATITDLTLSSVVVNTSRLLFVDCFVHVESSVASDGARLRIKRDGTTIGIAQIQLHLTTSQYVSLYLPVLDTPAAGTYEYTATMERFTGSGSLQVTAASTAKCLLRVQGVGPQS